MPSNPIVETSAATRRRQRVVDSADSLSESGAEHDEDAEGEIDEEDVDREVMQSDDLSDIVDEDAEGEEDAEIDELAEDEDDFAEEEEEEEAKPAPSTKLKLKFKVNNAKASSSSSSSSANKRKRNDEPAPRRTSGRAVKKVSMAEDDLEEDELASDGSDEEASMVRNQTNPARLTARQRSRQNGDLQEHLMSLPAAESSKKADDLTDLEKARKREENARRRKLQQDQKQENDKIEAINRLLKAQSGRGRGTRTPRGGEEGSRAGSVPAGGADGTSATVPHLIRIVSSIKDGDFKMSVSLPVNQDVKFDAPPANTSLAFKDHAGSCDVQGCDKRRIYRLSKRPDIGACSASHLKQVEAGL